jgi:O-acetyl-ADP-ribose deacetylase (regulator of RNase III)
MISYRQGNLLESHARALVNAVNTVGVMGKGIALMFKKRFRENFEQYAVACKNQQVRIGKMFITMTGEPDGPKWIVNFPTKQNWRAPSKLEWIEEGLKDLRRFIMEERVVSIAIPALGAGNGGLNWSDVKAEIEKALGDLTDVDVVVFEPTEQHPSGQSTQAFRK